MSQKHTPGPWILVKHGENQSERYDVNGYVDGDLTTLAQVHHDAQEWEEFEANARLISAAPDLLEACKFFMASLESGLLVRDITKDSAPTWATSMMEFVRDLGKAQAAIAKAESVKQ